MEELIQKEMIRQYYLAEALAIYDAYYRPLVSTFAPSEHRRKIENRKDDRPLTWVPLVFHCTTHSAFKGIVESGKLSIDKGYVSFTEMPLGELDRMKIRHQNEEQVAIAFPRRLLEKVGMSPVIYAQHESEVSKVLSKVIKENPVLRPFVELTDDVSAFQELRTTREIKIEDAIWLLTTKRSDDSDRTPALPSIDKFETQFGKISLSYWHRSHQMGILGELRYLSFQRDENRCVKKMHCTGEFYADRKPFRFEVSLPKKSAQIALRSIKKGEDNFESAMYDIDVAFAIRTELLACKQCSLEEILRYRQINEFPAGFGT